MTVTRIYGLTMIYSISRFYFDQWNDKHFYLIVCLLLLSTLNDLGHIVVASSFGGGYRKADRINDHWQENCQSILSINI